MTEPLASDVPLLREQLMTIDEVAGLLRMPAATLRYWRVLDSGPSGVIIGRRLRYWRHDVLAWLEVQCESTSVLEQRTGRLDRIGALAEHDGDIAVHEPFLAGTHDEKMYKVVKDRAGWFDIVMGRAAGGDESGTDREETRVPLADSIARALTMNLQSR